MQPHFTQLLTTQLFTPKIIKEVLKEVLVETLVEDIQQNKKYGTPVAVIDLGTNICRLLIADKIENDGNQNDSHQNHNNLNFRILHQEKITVKIGQGGISEGLIGQAAQVRLLDALQRFRFTLDKYEIKDENIFAAATSAMRNASNQNEVLEQIKQETNLDLQVISGEQEAEYIYKGVRLGMDIGEEIALMMDIGGGSVEFILCNKHKIFWKHSFEVGAQRLLDMFMPNDPIKPQEIKRLENYLEDKLIPLANAIHQYTPTFLIGSSGTFDTIHDIKLAKNNIDKLNNTENMEFSKQEFLEIYYDFIHKNKQERLQINGMKEMRVEMIVVASCLINFILEKYQLSRICVSRYGLKEGLLSMIYEV